MMTVGALAALAVIASATLYRTHVGQLASVELIVPTLVLLVVVFTLAAPARTYRRYPMADGRVVAIVPAHREDPAALHDTIRSLLDGTRAPDEIHVVDDGSPDPIPAFVHPRVVWHRQQVNGGKRRAQAVALRQLDPTTEFILTVDSDCTVDRYAVQRLLQAMADDDVQAATGLPLTRNRRRLLPRIIDLEIASICLTYRSARSRLGSLTTCSGALSLYRAPVILDNVDDYTAGVHAGDDRRLTHYALLRGRVVSVPDAVVQTDMPATLRALYRQRVRWSSSHWHYTPWEMAHLPTGAMLWTAYLAVLSVLVPLALVWTLIVHPLAGGGVVWELFAYWTVSCWLMTAKYTVGRPGMPAPERFATWLFGVPLMILVQLVIYRPAMLHALAKTRSTQWGTRGAGARGRYRGARVAVLADASA